MCPVSDVVAEIVAAVADAAPYVAEGTAAAATAADAAGAFGGAGSASAGLDTSSLTSGAINDTSTATSLLDQSATQGLASGTANLAGALPDTAGAGSTAALGGSTAGTTLPEVTVTGTAPAAAGAGGGGLGGLAGGVGGALGLGSLAQSVGPQASGAQTPTANDLGGGNSLNPLDLSADTSGAPGSITDAGATFIPPYSEPTQLADPGSFGIDQLQPDLSTPEFNPNDNVNFPSVDTGDGGGGFGDITHWLSNPKNAGTAGLLGLSLKNALTQPKLPGALGTANANANAATANALPIIQSGGTATPAWETQKASIDASINQQIKQQSEAIQQAAANSGEGNQNSGIVQQQIAQMTSNLNVQRQQLYAQAQQQNVQNALSELSGGDQVLTQIGATQLQQSEEAQQLAAQTAEMALLLQSGGTMKMLGVGT